MQGFESTLAKTAAQFDRVRVADRSGAVLYDSRLENIKAATALVALINGQVLTDAKLGEVTVAWGKVESAAVHRHAPDAYREVVSDHARRLEAQQKELSIELKLYLPEAVWCLGRQPVFLQKTPTSRQSRLP